MRNICYTLCILLLLFSCSGKQELKNTSVILTKIDTTTIKMVQLARPNSGTYTFEEAENKKGEIYDMQLSVKHVDWKNPTSGGAIHINKNDEIEVYQFTMGMMYVGEGIDKHGDSIVYIDKAPKDTSIVVQKKHIKNHVGGVGFGNPASVLITSEFNLKKSKSLPLVLEELFESATQIYYLKRKPKK